MQARSSVRRLLLTLVLSQALACQALVAAWSGAIAAGLHTSGMSCSGMSADPDAAACHAVNLSGQPLAFARLGTPAAIQSPHVAALLERTEAPGFLARAPPVAT